MSSSTSSGRPVRVNEHTLRRLLSSFRVFKGAELACDRMVTAAQGIYNEARGVWDDDLRRTAETLGLSLPAVPQGAAQTHTYDVDFDTGDLRVIARPQGSQEGAAGAAADQNRQAGNANERPTA